MVSTRLYSALLLLVPLSYGATAQAELCRISKDEDLLIYRQSLRSRNSIIEDREQTISDYKRQGKVATEEDLPQLPTPVGVLSERDFFNCNNNKRTLEGEQIIPGPKGEDLYILLPVYNETTSREEADRLGDSAYYKPQGKELEIFLDGTPGRVTQFFDRPGISWKDVENNVGKGVAWPKVGDQTKTFKVTDTSFIPDYYDPVLHHKVGRMFYKVDIFTNGKKSATGWVDSLKIRHDKLTYIPDTETTFAPKEEDKKEDSKTTATDECCKPKEGLDIDKGKIQEALEQIIPYQAPKKKFFGKVNELIKNQPCPINQSKKNQFVKQAKINKRAVGDEFKVKAKSTYAGFTVENASATQMAAIDMYARTIYGEMRNCHNNLGEHYSKAQARVALNRAEACQRNKSCGFVDKKDNTANLSEAIMSVLGQEKQFSVWNPYDNNLDDVLCIQGKVDVAIWQDAVDIAAQAILDTENFKKATRSVGENTYHYISLNAAIKWREPKWAAKMRKVNNIRIDGLPVDKHSCIRAYSSKAIAENQKDLRKDVSNKYATTVQLRGAYK